MTLIYTDDQVIMDFDQGCLCTMESMVYRLNRREETIDVGMVSDPGIDDTCLSV